MSETFLRRAFFAATFLCMAVLGALTIDTLRQVVSARTLFHVSRGALAPVRAAFTGHAKAATPAMLALFLFGLPADVSAHCDSVAGPVVGAARVALETGAVDPALRWVRASKEPEVRGAFDRAIAVRRLNAQARDLADRFFFETVVRLHRLGEGEPYTGLKDELAIEPIIRMADEAIASGRDDHLVEHLTGQVASDIRARFAVVRERMKTADASVEAGRAYVAAYVALIHYVEALGKDGHKN